jgi:glycosyltransferase involved in cell wall biosynthesis
MTGAHSRRSSAHTTGSCPPPRKEAVRQRSDEPAGGIMSGIDMPLPQAMNGSAEKIVHVTASYPPALGGMERTAQALARHQCELGMRVSVLTSDQGRNEMPPEREPFPVTRLKSFVVAHTPIIPGLLHELFGVDRTSIIHLHLCQAYTPETVWLCARLRNIRYVVHAHGADVMASGWAGPLLKPYKKVLIRRVLRDAGAVIVPTDDYRNLICSKYCIPPERVVVVPNGSDHEIVQQSKSIGAERKERRLLFVGRLSIQKNLPLLLRAVAMYIEKYDSDIQLTMVGEGEMRPAIEAEIHRLGLAANAALPGAFCGETLETIYKTSDLFLLTSFEESFGLVLVEAMTKALPIVSVNIPSVRNVVTSGVNGLLVEPTPEAVAEAIHSMLTDREFYSEVSRCNLAKSHDYRWKAAAEEISKIYDRLCLRRLNRSGIAGNGAMCRYVLWPQASERGLASAAVVLRDVVQATDHRRVPAAG